MKKLLALTVACALASGYSLTSAADQAADQATCGPETGSHLGAFGVTKVAGAEDDGVEMGKDLCYRCRNGSRPQVVVFTRSTDPAVVMLVSKLDEAVAKNEDAQLRVFVNLIGNDRDALMDDAKKLAMKTSAKNIPFVVPTDFETGPRNYNIDESTAVHIVMANDSMVTGNVAIANPSQIDVNQIVSKLGEMLN